MTSRFPDIFTLLRLVRMRLVRMRPIRLAIGGFAASAMLMASLVCTCLGTAHEAHRDYADYAASSPISHHCHDPSGSEQLPQPEQSQQHNTDDAHSPFCPHCNTGQLTTPQSVAISIPVVIHHVDLSWPLAAPVVPSSVSDLAIVTNADVQRWRMRIPIDHLLSPLAQSSRLII